MRKIAIFNQKGGVGKTTTAINLAAGLSRNGRKVVIIDIDPQGDVSVCYDTSAEKSLSDVIMAEAQIEEATTKMGKNLDIIRSDSRLAEAEQMLTASRQELNIFEKCFTPKLDYDYVLLDCPPSLRYLNKCALFYSKELIIPCTTDFLGYDALLKTINTVTNFNAEYKHNLMVTLIVPTMYDKRRKICSEILEQMKSEFTSPLVSNPIRANSKLTETPKAKQSIFSYAKNSDGANDYWAIVKLILENENMYDTRFSNEQRLNALQEYYTQGKKRELMMVGNKLTFGFKFFTNGVGIKEHINGISKKRVKSV